MDLSKNELSGHLPPLDWITNQHLKDTTSSSTSSGLNNGTDQDIEEGVRKKDESSSRHPLCHLELVDLSENILSGPLPSWLRTLPKIRHLTLRANRLNGTIDPLFNQSKEVINEKEKGIKGVSPVPVSSGFRSRCGGMMRRDELIIPTLSLPISNTPSNTPSSFTQPLQVDQGVDISNVSLLETHQLDNEQQPTEVINESESVCFDFLSELRSLDLSYNQFTGLIPISLKKLKGLVELDLSSNHFGGDFPLACLAYTRDLRHISLHGNQLLTVQAEIYGAIDLMKPLGVVLDKEANVIAISSQQSIVSQDDIKQDEGNKEVTFPSLFNQDHIENNDEASAVDETSAIDETSAVDDTTNATTVTTVSDDKVGVPSLVQGGLRVGCKIVSVGDTTVNTTAEVEEALARWKYVGEKIAPISFKVIKNILYTI